MKKAIIISCALLFLTGCGESTISEFSVAVETSAPEASLPETSITTEITTKVAEIEKKKPKIDESKPEVSFWGDPSFSKENNNKYLNLSFIFYNKSERNKSFSESYTVHVYRNGNELSVSDYEFSEFFSVEVSPGTSKQINMNYEVENYDATINEEFSVIVEDNNVSKRYVIDATLQSIQLYYYVYEDNGDVTIYKDGEKKHIIHT